MGWVSVVLVCFAALNALVIVLARDVTSRWERGDDPGTPVTDLPQGSLP